MSLSLARHTDGTPVELPGEPPFPATALDVLFEEPFSLPCDDPWLLEEGSDGHAYLEAARRAWQDDPEWMDFLDLESPCYALKRLERDLAMDVWKPWLSAQRVLDVGCGIGRFVQPLLDRGAEVWATDGDLMSLQRCAWHAAGRRGKLELAWTSAHQLPDWGDFDVAIASEVLCYVPDTEGALARIVERLRPGGALLISMEARWGWATAEDAPEDAVEQALSGDGIVDIPGDRWVRTLDRDGMTALLEGAGLSIERLLPTHYLTDGPLERVLPRPFFLEQALAWEERCRRHPIWSPLNRLWTAVALKS